MGTKIKQSGLKMELNVNEYNQAAHYFQKRYYNKIAILFPRKGVRYITSTKKTTPQ